MAIEYLANECVADAPLQLVHACEEDRMCPYRTNATALIVRTSPMCSVAEAMQLGREDSVPDHNPSMERLGANEQHAMLGWDINGSKQLI